MGIEPTSEAWEAPVLPMNYARKRDGNVTLHPVDAPQLVNDSSIVTAPVRNFMVISLKCLRDFD